MHSLITESSFYFTVLDIALIIWVAPEWIGTYFQRSKQGAVKRDRGSHLALILSLTAGMVVAVYCVQDIPSTTITWLQIPLFWTGIVLMLAGVAFRWYAIRMLGRFFTRDVATRADQVVVEAGPYHWIRHPSYSGGLLTALGFGLALTNWLALLAILCGALIGYAYRVHVEERALCEALGDAYRDYMRRTKRFIPFVW
ncbi:MAG: methyltransferase family protein [Gammaproteobacteria bacterium]